ncbi:MAG: hypothetical protein ACRC46_10555 [Thermoguttaceae bacterium]
MNAIHTIIVNWFRERIVRDLDRALDDGQPPRGLAAFALRHSTELQRYYESMLAMELALRFAPHDNVSHDDATTSQTLRPASRATAKLPQRTMRWTRLAIAATVLIVGVALWLRPTAVNSPPEEIVAVTETDSVPFAEITLFTDAIAESALPQFGFPVGTVVSFADAPLTTTLSILETAGIVASQETITN